MESNRQNARILSLAYQDGDSGWTVLKCRSTDNHKDFTAVGFFSEVQPGELWLLFGDWSQHRQFGRQFKIERAVEQRPTSKAGICRYLASGVYKGIGPKTAERIVDHFGSTTFDVLDHEPEKLKSVPKIGKRVALNLVASWQAKRGEADTLMFLSSHGIAGSLARKVIKTYSGRSESILEIISQNPYTLIRDVAGIGFLTADRIAMSVGIKTDDSKRIEEAVVYALEKASDTGHCFQTAAQIGSALQKQLRISCETVEQELNGALSRLNCLMRVVTVDGFTVDGQLATCHYLCDLLIAESEVCEHLLRLRDGAFAGLDPKETAVRTRMETWLKRYCEKMGSQLSSDQWQSVIEAATSKVFVLTGGPGVGKTTTANAIIQLLKAMGRTTYLCAPTGRAAQRLSELSGMTAKTIHRTLEWAPGQGGFTRDASNPLTAQVIVVDEASMLDIRLANALLDAIPSSAQLILIGDADQLPAVGPGNVLRDILASKVIASACLTEVFRQAASSKIVAHAHTINAGTVPEFENISASDCQFWELGDSAAVIARLKELVSEHLPNAGYSAATQVQILTPVNRGELGSQNLNMLLQETINPKSTSLPQYKHHGVEFRLHDKVIQTVNNYELSVYNGDIGYIVAVDSQARKLQVDYLGRQITYESEHIGDLQLAYAITIHKSQGSEFPVVIIPIVMGHFIMLQRNLVYTALTRARRLAIFIGQTQALRTATNNCSSFHRRTHLAARLTGPKMEQEQ